MTEELTNLLKEFATKFPNLDLMSVTTPYNRIESMLQPHTDEFTKEQWEAILSNTYNELFQDGVPHYSWNTDRGFLARSIIEENNLRPSVTGKETWFSCSEYYYTTPTGVILKIKVKEPISFSGGRIHYRINIVDKSIPIPDYRAVIISIGENTEAYIASQFAGTQEQCEDWVAKKLSEYKTGSAFKIIKI